MQRETARRAAAQRGPGALVSVVLCRCAAPVRRVVDVGAGASRRDAPAAQRARCSWPSRAVQAALTWPVQPVNAVCAGVAVALLRTGRRVCASFLLFLLLSDFVVRIAVNGMAVRCSALQRPNTSASVWGGLSSGDLRGCRLAVRCVASMHNQGSVSQPLYVSWYASWYHVCSCGGLIWGGLQIALNTRTTWISRCTGRCC
jgi:hypothetical protein